MSTDLVHDKMSATHQQSYSFLIIHYFKRKLWGRQDDSVIVLVREKATL